MLLIKQNSGNEFIIYANTISNEVQSFGDHFLIGFQNGFTKEWSYVVPFVLSRNSRFIRFQINTVATVVEEDPLNHVVYLSPSMNWVYKVWNTEIPTLNPSLGNVIDEGQMILEFQEVPEIPFVSYKSSNDSAKSFVYYTSNGIWNNTAQLWNYYESEWNRN